MIVEQIKTKEKLPDESGWYDTDNGNLFFFFTEKQWSCRDDRISEEFPSLWYDPVIKVENSELVGIHAEELKNVVGIIAKLHQDHKTVIIVGNNQEYAENIPLRPRLEDIEPLFIKALPTFEKIHSHKEKRTNHDRLPSRFGRRKQ